MCLGGGNARSPDPYPIPGSGSLNLEERAARPGAHSGASFPGSANPAFSAVPRLPRVDRRPSFLSPTVLCQRAPCLPPTTQPNKPNRGPPQYKPSSPALNLIVNPAHLSLPDLRGQPSITCTSLQWTTLARTQRTSWSPTSTCICRYPTGLLVGLPWSVSRLCPPPTHWPRKALNLPLSWGGDLSSLADTGATEHSPC